VAVTCEWDSDLVIPAMEGDGHETPPSMHLYRMVQEALSNAIRHGGANHCIIRSRCHDGLNELIIEDDGTGFEPPLPHHSEHQSPPTGMGLRILAFRASRIGGQLSITRRHEGGMRVAVTWPSLTTPPVR
jgi:signal transduction histidine kinase